MSAFESGAFDVIKAWHAEWSRIPMYVATLSFGAIAFSITNLWQGNATSAAANLSFMKASWICLGLSAGLASAGILLSYLAFDFGVRVHLESTLRSLSIRVPRKDTAWIGYFGRASWVCSVAAILLLLAGCSLLVLFALAGVQ